MVTDDRVARHLGELHAKVEELAERAGVSFADRRDTEAALAALPWPDRRRLRLVLQSVRAHADGEALHTAVDMMLALAGEVWTRSPPPEAAMPDEGLERGASAD